MSWEGSSIVFPAELAQAANEVYFLHVLATDPSKVVPPGKSILSMLLSRSSSQQAKAAPEAKNGMADLQARVEKMVHKAFWDEVSCVLTNAPVPH